MPVMDGFDATIQIRELEAAQGRDRTPIMALTAAAREQEFRRAIDCGMDEFMTKPFEIDELTTRIAALLQARQQVQKIWLFESGRSPPACCECRRKLGGSKCQSARQHQSD